MKGVFVITSVIAMLLVLVISCARIKCKPLIEYQGKHISAKAFLKDISPSVDVSPEKIREASEKAALLDRWLYEMCMRYKDGIISKEKYDEYLERCMTLVEETILRLSDVSERKNAERTLSNFVNKVQKIRIDYERLEDTPIIEKEKSIIPNSKKEIPERKKEIPDRKGE